MDGKKYGWCLGELAINPVEVSFEGMGEVDELLAIPPERIACLDLETTGLSPQLDEVLQVSICDGNSSMLLDTYVRPVLAKSWPEAERVNHISPGMVEGAPELSDVARDIEAILRGCSLLVGYNARGFDLPFLSCGGVAVPEGILVYDLMPDCSVVHGRWNDCHGDYTYVSLGYVAGLYGIDFGAHDSAEDARATARLFREFLGGEPLAVAMAGRRR